MANDEGQSSGPQTEDSSDPVVGHDSNRVMDDLTNDKIGILDQLRTQLSGSVGLSTCPLFAGVHRVIIRELLGRAALATVFLTSRSL